MNIKKYHLSYKGSITILFLLSIIAFIFAEPLANFLAMLFYKVLFIICKILGGL